MLVAHGCSWLPTVVVVVLVVVPFVDREEVQMSH